MTPECDECNEFIGVASADIRGRAYHSHICNDCDPVPQIYVASAMPTNYPWKLQKPSTWSKRVRDTAQKYIFDSGIGDDETNEDVLYYADELNADYVVAKDYLHDFEQTTESIKEFNRLFKKNEYDMTPLIPVQCDPENDKWHTDHLEHLPESSHYVLGGMAVDEVSTAEKIATIEAFRDAVGEDAYVHGLGVGGGIEFVSQVAPTGWLDSVDCSTPEQAAMFGAVIDARLRQQEVLAFPGGGGKNQRTHPLASFNSWQIRDVWIREHNETKTLAGYA